MGEVIIRRGPKFIITSDSMFLQNVDETMDGLAFEFKENMYLNVTLHDMPKAAKTAIIQAVKSPIMLDKRTTIDLINYIRPVSVEDIVDEGKLVPEESA